MGGFAFSGLQSIKFASGMLVALVLALLIPGSQTGRAASFQPPADLATAVEAFQHGECQTQLPALRSLSERSDPLGARAGYLLAHCLVQVGQFTDAQVTFDEVVGRYQPLALYARFYAALLVARTDAAADAADRLEELFAKAPSTPLARRTKLLYAEALVNAGRASEAAKVLRELLRGPSTDDDLAHVWWLLGQAAEGMGDRAQAVQAYAMAWWVVPRNRHVPDAIERLLTLSGGALPDPPPQARVERARRLAALKETGEAESELLNALHQNPPPSVAAEAWYQLGFLRLPSKGAVNAFEQALRYPGNSIRGLYWLGEALAAVGRSAKAKAAWWRVSREHPTSIWAARSLFALALSAEAERAWGETDRIFADIARRFPAWRIGDEARWRRGWLKYQRGKYAEAEAVLIASAQTAPGSARAAEEFYWASKAREKQGKDPRALLAQVAQRYPLTFVGQRARLRLGSPVPVRIPAPAPLRPRDDRFHAVHEELAALGFDREAADEAEALLESSPLPETRRFVAIHRARAGELRASVTAAGGATESALRGGGTIDAGWWELAYPRAYWDRVSTMAAAANVDPYLILAVMREESGYDPQAVSPAGAIGLMQVMPFTARALAEGEDVTTEKLMQPEVNIRYGATYLGAVLREFRGDVMLALAAYNAGPYAARRFARFPRKDLDLFIVNIPYAETRAYVQRVLETYGIYRWLYPQRTPATIRAQ